MGQDKDGLISEGKKKKKKQQAKQKKSLTTSHRQSNAQPVSEEHPPWKQKPLLPSCTPGFVLKHVII